MEVGYCRGGVATVAVYRGILLLYLLYPSLYSPLLCDGYVMVLLVFCEMFSSY